MSKLAVSATDAKQNLGRLLGRVERSAYQIQKNGRTVAYLDGALRHERLERVAATGLGRRLVTADRYRAGELSRDEAMEEMGVATVQELIAWVSALGDGLPRLDNERASQLAKEFLRLLKA